MEVHYSFVILTENGWIEAEWEDEVPAVPRVGDRVQLQLDEAGAQVYLRVLSIDYVYGHLLYIQLENLDARDWSDMGVMLMFAVNDDHSQYTVSHAYPEEYATKLFAQMTAYDGVKR